MLVVWRLDRLGRNLRHLITLLDAVALLAHALLPRYDWQRVPDWSPRVYARFDRWTGTATMLRYDTRYLTLPPEPPTDFRSRRSLGVSSHALRGTWRDMVRADLVYQEQERLDAKAQSVAGRPRRDLMHREVES